MASSFLILLEGVKLMCSSVSLLCIENPFWKLNLKHSSQCSHTIHLLDSMLFLIFLKTCILDEAHPMLVEVNILEDPTGIAGIPWKQHGSK